MSAPPLQWRRALVVFSDRADLVWLRLLRRGFRHCFLVLGSSGGWVSLNAMAHRVEVAVLPVAADFDLAGWYRTRGLTVVETAPVLPPRRPLPLRPFTCVEMVKRSLGIADGGIFTPWQLFRYFSRESDIILDDKAGVDVVSSHQRHIRA
ncbi:hypothetical protein [Magnetospirillum sp. SS-4]|uniref:hypothetical protein n=1 Tax=Magnetospirillum sp. SS-4 TaxID=2681465 RepID=UPI0013845B29|nr:hypothetical protein [Magnetospirillum sp. SS-4]CAA7627411.1 hypothetical protein MTBSS4_80047 [Magnetospirillum sp. SS-4]